MTANEKLSALRCEMKNAGADIYIIPTSDFHDSEYVSPHFAARRWFSGFTGSAGTLVVTAAEAALFTDGRYFIQAENQLAGSEIKLMKTGESGVPTVREYVSRQLPDGGSIGFDGRVMTAETGEYYKKTAEKKGGKIIDADLAGIVWKDRPPLIHTPIFLLDEKFSGRSAADKLEELRKKMSEKNADVHIMTVLDQTSWLFNIRARDIEYCPVVLSCAAVTAEEACVFLDEKACGSEVREYLNKNGVTVKPYADIYRYVKTLSGKRLLLDKRRASYTIAKLAGGCGNCESCEIISEPSPTELMKAVKNPTEIQNARQAHLWDGIAVTKLMYWVKTNAGKRSITEYEAAEYADDMRRKTGGEHFIMPSFETISAYGANAAMMHYSADPENCAELRSEGMLLVDSGGHYYEGTTDITRTFALGRITDEMRAHFTLTLRAMLNLAAAKFMYGCRGENLDILSRGVLWEKGLDYRCGTGHGVGCLLSVHEGPNSFRHKLSESRPMSAVLEEGMITTDEPGVYAENSHGIRIENELLCKKAEKTEYGQFMEFEPLTLAPIDLDCIDISAMTETDKVRLNSYHKTVYDRLSPYFEGEELEFLKKYTRAV